MGLRPFLFFLTLFTNFGEGEFSVVRTGLSSLALSHLGMGSKSPLLCGTSTVEQLGVVLQQKKE